AFASRILECGDDYSLDPLSRVDLLLDCQLVRRSLLEVAANENVHALGILTKDHKIHITRTARGQRTQRGVEQLDRSEIDIEVQAHSHAEQNVLGVPVIWNPGIAKCAGQDRIEAV